MTRQERAETMNAICDKVGCNAKQRERHERLFADEQWNVHPSKRFKAWWLKQPEYLESIYGGSSGISPITAQNAKRIWQEYLEAKEIGIA